MKIQTKTTVLGLILIATLMGSSGLQAQTFLSGDWTQSSPAAVTVGVDTNGTLVATAPLNSSLTFNSTETSTTNPQFLWVPAWGALRVGSFSSAPSTTTMGQYSMALGNSARATGANSVALGSNALSSATYSLSMGFYSSATGIYATAIGNYSVASANSATAIGCGATASGACSVALGYFPSALGTFSMATGNSTSTSSYNCFTAGRYNQDFNEGGAAPSSSSWLSSDPLFEIGNGTSSNAKSNALVVYKNGDAVFSPAPGSTSCSVIAPVFITTASGGSGDIPMYTGN